MILAQDVGHEPPNSISSSDLGQMFEQGRSHAKRMIFMRDHYRDFSSFRVVADDDVVAPHRSVGRRRMHQERTALRMLDQLANELVEIDLVSA